ncbi:amiloride-sensitive sodium channel subunit gamma [Corchorus olitorius]|uniref:Amiloride-sensitive sodium channel subunit gamma n=1 Tax=Corchorus olitorius TaxID=93759 RepID=A0A1R3INR3_9ROSI|nr:amiloride-sensitive sodium channel subunit gamma [Corchorus olitorius]
MRQKYLRSYPLILPSDDDTQKQQQNYVGQKTKKWFKYRIFEQENDHHHIHDHSINNMQKGEGKSKSSSKPKPGGGLRSSSSNVFKFVANYLRR